MLNAKIKHLEDYPLRKDIFMAAYKNGYETLTEEEYNVIMRVMLGYNVSIIDPNLERIFNI